MTRIVIKNDYQIRKIDTNEYKNDNDNPSWLNALTPKIKQLIKISGVYQEQNIEEIRLRINRPLIIRLGFQELTIDKSGNLISDFDRGFVVTEEDLHLTMQVLSQNSFYAWEEEFRNGYITIPGGHRIGFVGRSVLDKGSIKTLKEISGINYRIGRQVLDCAKRLVPFIIEGPQIYHTLIISPPQCGKTTMLRDLIRHVSDGDNTGRYLGVNVGVVDERSEIAGMYRGRPQFNIGLRTDVLDACPKAIGMMMLIRSMSPRVIATDEIGRHEDIEALYQALQAGVTVITTVHGNDIEQIKKRPVLQDLIKNNFFKRIVVLSRKKGVGHLEGVIDGESLERIDR